MKRVIAACAAFSILSAGVSLAAVTQSELDNRIWESKEVIEEFRAMPEDGIPPSLLQKAKAIAIFPNTVKAGLFAAGQFGQGVVLTRDDKTGEWSAPAFYRISGGSFGLQVGGQSSDIILVVTNDRGVQGLLRNKFTLGADASVAAGPAGRDAEAMTDWHLKANILSYSRSKGLFAGVSVDGMMVNQDREANELYYGGAITAEDILINRKVKPADKSKELIEELKRYTA